MESCLEDEGNRILYLDVQSFLVDNIFEYTDKMSIVVALEVRVLLLDYRFVELSLNIPFVYKLRNDQSKLLLRETFKDSSQKKQGRYPCAGSTPHYRIGYNAPSMIILRRFKLHHIPSTGSLARM
jgi:asparagine synthetase B (glutamine-hydrolysing)